MTRVLRSISSATTPALFIHPASMLSGLVTAPVTPAQPPAVYCLNLDRCRTGDACQSVGCSSSQRARRPRPSASNVSQEGQGQESHGFKRGHAPSPRAHLPAGARCRWGEGSRAGNRCVSPLSLKWQCNVVPVAAVAPADNEAKIGMLIRWGCRARSQKGEPRPSAAGFQNGQHAKD